MEKFIEAIRIVWGDIISGKNLDAYIAILFGVILTLLDIFDLTSTDVVGPGILLVLTFLVFGSLANRRAIRRFENSVSKITPQDDLFGTIEFPGETLGRILRESKSIGLLGISLYRMISLYYTDVQFALEQGGELKILLVNPESPAIEMVAFRGTLQHSVGNRSTTSKR